MNDQLEAELREAFARRAAEVSSDAAERLRSVDYKPHARRRWPLTVSAAGAASGTAAIVSVVMLGGSQAAFAGWSATPTAATDTQSTTTQENCQGYLATMPGGSGSWTQVATDVRGPYTVAVYESGDTVASCFTGPSFTTAQVESLTSSGKEMAVTANGSSPPTPGSSSGVDLLSGGGVEQLMVSHLSQAENGAYTLVEGRLVSGVSAVTLVLGDGQDVAATTGSGWVVAWWPGSQDVASAQVTTASGTTTETLSAAPPPQPPSAGNASPGTMTAVPAGSGPDGP